MSLSEKHLLVLRRVRDVYGDRIYENASQSRSVRAQVDYLARHGLIEPHDRDGESGWARTAAGNDALADATGEA